jgi:hypothetical protein
VNVDAVVEAPAAIVSDPGLIVPKLPTAEVRVEL